MKQELIESLGRIVGPIGLLLGEDVSSRHTNTVNPQPLQASVLVRPASTAEVSAVLAACHAAGVPVVPQGGLTGLVHGADALPQEVVLSLERMNRLEPVDATQRVLVGEAGVVLEQAQAAARNADLMLPVDLGARGSATLGGLVSTNAGGNRVIRHGMTRENVLGLEAVLADGTVISSMNQLVKNNSGYDLKHLFIGSEGTLGVVTRVVWRLRESPSNSAAALLALDDFEAVARLLRSLDKLLEGALTAFEVMWQDYYRLVTTAPAAARPPISQDHAFYVLVEACGEGPGLADRFEAALSVHMEDGLIVDAVIGQSEREREAFWALRDDVSQMGRMGPPVGYDVSLKLADTGNYVSSVSAAIKAKWPEAQVWAFGHLGDGNVHLVVQVPGLNHVAHQALDQLVYSPLKALAGAVSAEHGIGLEKKAWLGCSRSPAEQNLMRQLKRCLDPKNILNPGRVFDVNGNRSNTSEQNL